MDYTNNEYSFTSMFFKINRNMNKACFLAPIHPPKFNYGLELVKSYNTYYDDDHIYLIFSSQEDSNLFQQLANGLNYCSIITPWIYSALPPSDEKFNNLKLLFENTSFRFEKSHSLFSGSYTTEKKFHGLKWLFENTEFENVGVIDVDSIFTKTVDYEQLFKLWYERGVIYSSKFDYAPFPIIMSPLRFFNDTERLKIQELTQNFSVYFWFYDIPVFNKTHFTNFMDYIKFPEISKDLVWLDFDFIFYAYYLIIKDIVKLDILKLNENYFNYNFIEGQLSIPEEEFKQVFKTYYPMWIIKDLEPELMNQTFMNVHVDRV